MATDAPADGEHPLLVSREMLKEIAEYLPGQRAERQYRADREWLEEHRAELLEEHPESWVAIRRYKVIESAPRLEDLIKKLRGRRTKTSNVVFDHLTRRKVTMLFRVDNAHD